MHDNIWRLHPRLIKGARVASVSAVICLLILAGFYASSPAKKSAAPAKGMPAGPPPVVTVVPVTQQDINPPVEYVGHVEAIQAVDLRARVEGFLEKVDFHEGDTVRAGSRLFLIEQAPYQARVAADEARVAQAQAELSRASSLLDRLQRAGRQSVSATDLDNAVAARLQAEARLAQAEAALTQSRLDLDYTVVSAPITGRIGRTTYTRGNLVGPASAPLARLVQTDPIRVVYSISENDMAAVQQALRDATTAGQKPILVPHIRLPDGQPYPVPGRVDFVDNEVDPATGTIAVRAVFDNPDGRLVPGQYVTVLVARSRPRRLPVVPQAAVLTNQQGPFVLVVDPQGHAAARPITIGPAMGTNWAVTSGLKPGEGVILQGIQKVRPGQQVRIKSGGSQKR